MRTKFKLDAKIVQLKAGKYGIGSTNKQVEYTCPKCGERNRHLWFGRDFHYCNFCEHKTDIKGQE